MNPDVKKRFKPIEFPFTCPVTNRTFDSSKGLSVYVTKTLKMSHNHYYDEHIRVNMSNCFFCGRKGTFIDISRGYRNLCDSEVCKKKSFKSHSIEGFMFKHRCSEEEAKILFEEENKRQLEKRMESFQSLRESDPLWDKKRSNRCKEYWLERGFSEEESILKSNESIEDFHRKSFKTFTENPEKYASKYPTKIEYYLKRGYSEEDAIKLRSERQRTFSLDKCIEKYGEVEGLRVWKERQDKWLKTLDDKTDEEKIEIRRKKLFNRSGYSKVSQEFFWKIYENFSDNNIKFEELNGEVIRYDKVNDKHYRYDYVDFTLKKVIEFNGDFWHCNPEQYNENHIHRFLGKSAYELWEFDKIKSDWMESRGYKVMTVWESEWRKSPKTTIQKCLNFLIN